MPSFESTKLPLSKILESITEGKIQLPDFQRGWVWDDEHIRSLLVSIARSFPIGAIMLLEAGGEARFQIRPVEGITLPPGPNGAELLILDGQQRLTSLTKVLALSQAVRTRDEKNRTIDRYYYFDIEKALDASTSMDDAIFSVDESRTLRQNFGRDVVLDLGSPEREYKHFCFPCSQVLNSDAWEEGLMAFDANRFPRYMAFRKQVLNRFREYLLPVIELKKENSKEAVCLVFEKVNTGGVPLSVFELVTATYAADGFPLRDDWYGNPQKGGHGRRTTLTKKPLLRGIQPTDFLQGVSLLHSYERRQADYAAGRRGKEATAVSAKREHVLTMPLEAYKKWAERLLNGFLEADRFLRQEGFHKPEFLPYRTQLVPLAAVMVHLGPRWLEPRIRDKLTRWFWSGVLGELYGGAVETRIALDLQDLLAWIDLPDAPEPKTVLDANFHAGRLDTLRTRTSAAYRGLYVLLQREGAQDFFWKTRMIDLDLDDCKIDIHHIFPEDWCKQQKIDRRVYNTIVNKTALSYKANRMIGGQAPSLYLDQLRNHKQVGIDVATQNVILSSHLIDPDQLRSNDFAAFYQARKAALLSLVERALGKSALQPADGAEVDDDEDDEDGEGLSA